MKRPKLRASLMGLILVSAGMVAGAVVSPSGEAHGQARGTLPPTTFQSGGQLSVPVLQEIAATLRQIDARLARLETAAQKLQTPRSNLQSEHARTNQN